MAEQLGIALTQRAYTLRLSGSIRGDNSWRDRLWKTHEAVNKGAKSFGEWLLTMRGGLGSSLAEAEIAGLAGKPAGRLGAQAVKQRRILLALSWLSVESYESEKDAPQEYIVPHDVNTPSRTRSNWRTVEALREILQGQGVSDEEVGLWVQDCSASLLAPIRSDAVWVNRRRAFHDALVNLGLQVSEEDIWDFLGRFFSSPKVYLLPIEGTYNGENDSPTNSNTEEQGPKDLVQNASQWLSSRFGTGKGAQFGSIAVVYERIAKWADSAPSGLLGSEALARLADTLSEFGPSSQDLDGILKLVSGPGYKSATRNVLTKINNQGSCTADDLLSLRKKAETDAEKCKANTGSKGPRAYANAILRDVEARCGFTYLQEEGPARHRQFAVMLDHAARRVSAAHTWVKRAEAERREFETDAERIGTLPEDAREWLDQYCQERSRTSGALEPYRIRKRAVAGWKEIVTAWSKTNCQSEAHRISAARALQDDPEIDKFGDIQLFEALAAENALCVWRADGKPDSSPLLNYAAATDAEAKKRRFKVPAYRHPDALRHPVFCDFGKSRWDVSFDVHEAWKRPGKNKHSSCDLHAMKMALWDGTQVTETALRWASKRLISNLNIDTAASNLDRLRVPRADRLGRAAAGATEKESVRVAGVFEQEDWNGRLQVPRRDLDAMADHLKKCGNQWDAKADKMRDRVRWLVSFSPRLQPQGPWVEYVRENNLVGKTELNVSPRNSRDEWRGLAYPLWHPANAKGRRGLAKHLLSRFRGLRVLSVDLGHRYAAACAVWETMPTEQVNIACGGTEILPPDERDLYLHLKRIDGGVEKTTIYRRIASNVLPDGSPHPASWARLDRQFLIKLQGEDREARKASPAEIEAVERMEKEVGFQRHAPRKPVELAVDELMSDAMRIMRNALRRHTDCARIACNLITHKKLLPGGREETLTSEGRATLLTETLVSWRERFTGRRWSDGWAEKQWHAHMGPLLGEVILDAPQDDAEETTQERKKRISGWREKLKPVAERLSQNEALLSKLHIAWATRWRADDKLWFARLHWNRDWLMPHRVRSDKDKRRSIRHVGGLSLTRIATFKSFYQLQKAFHMRPEPDDLRKNIPQVGDGSLESFGQRMLDTLERMRENRAKQLASRIVEGALGVGRESRTEDKKDQRRPQERIGDPRFAPCHAVIIENLTNYRPEETQTRRENRQLMSWCSGKVKKYLSEACQLYGLHLREVSASYTSRQDSRTGAPGVRCTDVPVEEFLSSPRWRKEVRRAKEKQEKEKHSRDRYLCGLDDLWSTKSSENRKWRSVRIPVRGGEVFVSADSQSSVKRGMQADLNAAANIGLKALRDPDWPGSWWYIPCDESTKKPLKEKVGGCEAIDCSFSLVSQVEVEKLSSGRKRNKMAKRQTTAHESSRPSVVNLWRNPSIAPIMRTSDWQTVPEYWKRVQAKVVGLLTRDASSV